MNRRWRPRAGTPGAAFLILLAGCGSQPGIPPTATVPAAAAPDLDAEIARAAGLKRPLIVLIAESGKGEADDAARGLLDASNLGSHAGRIVSVLLDLRVSRNRATAARFHALETPVLLCLSPRAVIVSRDEKPLTKGLVLKRIDEVGPKAAELDAELAALEGPVNKDAADVKSRLALADFLQGRKNMREAIPHLVAVAHSDEADKDACVRAWVDLGLAHLWIAEPEKSRHEAEALIAGWGEKDPLAKAGGNLVLAKVDARGNRRALARKEFEEAIAAAPDSVYAREARDGLAKLPKERK